MHIFLLAAIAMPAAMISADPKPARIVSTNVCTDQIVMLLADHERIASISYLAQKPHASSMADIAQNFHANHGLAEEVAILNPDLVVTIKFGSPQVFLLRRMGYEVLEVPLALSLEDIRANVMMIADAIGEQQRGLKLVEEFDRKFEMAEQTMTNYKPVLGLFLANGFTFGGDTLVSQVVEKSGFRNLSNELGVSGPHRLPLELLISSEPDGLMLGGQGQSPALANELPNHPAIQRVFNEIPRIAEEGKLWICGTPFVADALTRLVDFRMSLPSQANGS